MAIITNTINGMTEISASSGKYLTQSYPTNFHEFYSKKMILPDDSVDNYKEVTETEKTQIETQDAKWEEPSKELIERWDREWFANSNYEHNRFGKYNTKTGFFEGNGLLNISLSQATQIINVGRIIDNVIDSVRGIFNYNIPTILPIFGEYRLSRNQFKFSNIIVVRLLDAYLINTFRNPDTTPIIVINSQEWGYGSNKLKEIKGIYNLELDTSYKKHFYNGIENCNTIERLKVINLFKSIYLGNASNFNIDCVDFMVENAKTVDAGQTITLHPNVYAQVSDELFGKASNKNITIATTTN